MKMKKNLLLCLALTLAGIAVSFLRPSFFETIEGKIYDVQMNFRGAVASSGRVAVVTIDEKSIQTLGRWPWSRALVAQVFEKILEHGARLVVPDIFFSVPSQGDAGEKSDAALAETIRRHPEILMGFYLLMTPEEVEESAMDAATMEKNFENLRGSVLSPKVRFAGGREAMGLQDTLPLFSNLPGRQGFFNIAGDPDGVVRSMPLVLSYRGEVFPSMMLRAVLSVAEGGDDPFLRRLPLDREGKLLVNYRDSAFERISADDLMEGRAGGSLSGKVVLVGATASGIEDNHPTPINTAMPSVLIGAHLLDNLLRGDFIRRDATTDLVSRIEIVLIGLLLGLVLYRLHPVRGLALFGLIVSCELVLHYFLFARARWALQNIYPLFSTFLVYGGATIHGFLSTEKNRRFITDTFSRYLSPDVIAEMVEHPEKIRLGGERKELTVFFCDIRDFSSMVEEMPPETVGEFLNSYLTPATEIIFKNKGLLDKYIGDAIMAVFGTPLPDPEHPRLACLAAVETLKMVEDSQERWQKEFNIPRLRVGVGINTGVMTVGNMGSEHRFDYTVMGDAVNLASRIEGLNKYYGTTLLVSEATFMKAKDSFLFREVDLVNVKGKKETTRLYELSVATAYDHERLFPRFAEGQALYRQGKFREAGKVFDECLQIAPDDGPSRLFRERCRKFESEPPREWTGVTTFLRK